MDFLFGKDPDIFDENGEVRHDLGERVWNNWETRYRAPEYDWRYHSGTEFQPPAKSAEAEQEERAIQAEKKAA